MGFNMLYRELGGLMKKLLFILFLLLSANAEATMEQLLIGADHSDIAGANYTSVVVRDCITDTEAAASNLLPVALDVTGFYFHSETGALGAGDTITLTIRKDGVDTAATITLSEGEATETWTGSVSFAAGDKISVGRAYTGTPYVIGNWNVRVKLADNTSVIMGGACDDAPSTVSKENNLIMGGHNYISTTTRFSAPIATGGTFKNLYVTQHRASGDGAGDSYTYTIVKNGADQSLTCTITGTSDTECSDTGNSFAVSAGDYLYLSVQEGGTGQSVYSHWSMEFEPTTNGNSVVMSGTDDNAANNNTEYMWLHGYQLPNYSATEANHVAYIGFETTVTGIAVQLENAPGSGNTSTWTVRENGSDTDNSVAITGTDESGVDTGSEVIAAGNYLTFSTAPDSFPTGGDSGWGILFYFTPEVVGSARRIMTMY